jgi:ATP-dependent DNA helicase
LYLDDSQKNQLDFLLSKAAEYSQFISNDLDDLQASMAADAAMAVEEESDGKKRKRSSKSGASKKVKALENLKSAHDKDAAVRSQVKDKIFRSPINLAKDCFLKDYQLEGVRWLVSLYENGVSGILADEM